MGSWNGTCGVTQLPINYNDKVKFFIIYKSDLNKHPGGGFCDPDDIWCPIGLPLSGRYNDYGSIEKIVDNIESRAVYDYLSKSLKCDDSFYDDGKTGLDRFVRIIERGSGSLNEKTPLGCMMVLDKVYDAMIQYNPVVTEHQEPSGYLYKRHSEVLENELKKWYDECLRINRELTNKFEIFNAKRFFIEQNLGTLRSLRKPHLAKQLLDRCSDDGLPWESLETQEAINAVINAITFNASLSVARKSWAPQCGAGSQDNDLDIYKIITNATKKIISSRDRKEARENVVEKQDKDGFYEWQLEHNKKFNG